jgi:hypothetical protein
MHICKLSCFAMIAVYAMLLENCISYAGTESTGEPTAVAADVWSYKFTPSYYVTTHTPDAIDLNLRAHYGAHAIWLGHYQRDSEFEQTRIGYEYTAQYPYIQLVPSLQLASHDFAGGSISAQIGGTVFALLGYGRTNAQDYYNLNFDPNDSVTFGMGTTLLPKSTLSVFATRDNRLNTDQTVIHAVWRMLPDDHQRWTLDVSSKYGRATPEDEAISGNAISLTYDNHDLFIRLAKDWKVNFSIEDQMRFTAGLRF